MRGFCSAVAVLVSACSFNGPANQGDGDGDGDLDAGIDAPPTSPLVRFTSITATISEIRPGLYGFEISAVLENQTELEIADVAVTLDAGDRDGDFFWRDRDAREDVAGVQPLTVAAGATETYVFVVDALASASAPGPITFNGSATFDLDGARQSATQSDAPLELGFAAEVGAPIVVTEPNDELDGDADLSLREAILLANSNAGFDRIVFDEGAFPAGTDVAIDDNLGPLPSVSEDLVIDGDGRPALSFDSNWSSNSNYGLRLSAGTLVVSGLVFRNMGYAYQDEDIAGTGNCGPSNTQFEGGAIRVDSGTLILDGNHFEDPDVPERNCFAASVRIEGGSDHRIVRNRWTAPSMDALYVDAATLEITDNVIDSTPNSGKSDECIYVNSQGNQDLWIIGNLCVDQEYSAVIARGNANGTLRVVHNTFVRTGLASLAAVRREQNNRPVMLRNNAYFANRMAVGPDNGGADFDIAYDASDAVYCNNCDGATVDAASQFSGALMVVNDSGTTTADFRPEPGSPLVDMATELIDRNGKSPRRFNGSGPDRGAVER